MSTIKSTASRIIGRKACVTATCPKTLTSNWWRSSLLLTNSIGAVFAIPALLTSPSRPRPSTRLPTKRMAASIVAPWMMSISTGTMASPPSRWRATPSLLLRTPAKTRKPRLAKSRAQARPMPLEAPVMTTDCCADLVMNAPSLFSILFSSGPEGRGAGPSAAAWGGNRAATPVPTRACSLAPAHSTPRTSRP